jgi:hypothetical protein
MAVGEAHTVLAGWGPDETYWLTDALDPAGPFTEWTQQDEEPLRWAIRAANAQAE